MPKADLRQAMRESAKTAPKPIEDIRERAQSIVTRAPSDNPHYRPGRAMQVNVTGYFPPEVKKQLRLLSAEQDKTIQQILAEALNDVFAKYGKPELAPIKDN